MLLVKLRLKLGNILRFLFLRSKAYNSYFRGIIKKILGSSNLFIKYSSINMLGILSEADL